MSVNFLHYAWPVSPYSAKTRAYLTFKRIPFVEVAPSAITLFGDIRKAVGAAVMPTVVTPRGSGCRTARRSSTRSRRASHARR
jgi:hypothetical protein